MRESTLVANAELPRSGGADRAPIEVAVGVLFRPAAPPVLVTVLSNPLPCAAEAAERSDAPACCEVVAGVPGEGGGGGGGGGAGAFDPPKIPILAPKRIVSAALRFDALDVRGERIIFCSVTAARVAPLGPGDRRRKRQH